MQSYDYARRTGVEEITWERFGQLAAALSELVAALDVDAVVGVARAGLLPAAAVACALRRDLFPVRLSRREQDVVTRRRPEWLVDVTPLVAGRRVVVVDEMADTGETLAMVAERARAQGAAAVFTAALVRHSWAAPAPDCAALTCDALVIFPWDRLVFQDGRWQPHPELLDALSRQPPR